jgi:hypothetical protein
MYANALVAGRWWGSADSASIVDFKDCARCDFRWTDGGYAYELFDSYEEAEANMNRLGFFVDHA